MKMTVNKVLNSIQGLSELNKTKLPMDLSLKLGRNSRQLHEVQEEFNKRRADVIEAYGKLDTETGETRVMAEHMKSFNEEMTALAEEEVEIEVIQVTREDFPEDFEIEPSALIFLEWMISE